MDLEEAKENFARNLRARRKEKGYGSREFSRNVYGTNNPSIICHYEKRRRVPTFKDLVKICEALDTTPDQLMGYLTSER